MKHEQAWSLLDDYENGDLPASKRAEVDAHVAECEECSAQVSVMKLLKHPQVVLGVRNLAELHPADEQLTSYALMPHELPAHEREHVDRHLRSCTECRESVQLARRAARWADGWWSGVAALLASWFTRPDGSLLPERLLVPAMGLLVVLMAYPAYRGIVLSPEFPMAVEGPAPTAVGSTVPEVPQPSPRAGAEGAPPAPPAGDISAQRTEQIAALSHELDSLRRLLAQEPLPTLAARPVAGLVVEPQEFLEGLLVAGGRVSPGIKAARPPAPTPGRVVSLRPGQESLPVLLGADLAAQGGNALDREYAIDLWRDHETVPVWQVRARGRDVWQSDHRSILLIVPTRALTSGAFHLQLTDVTLDRPLGAVRFSIVTPAQLAPSR